MSYNVLTIADEKETKWRTILYVQQMHMRECHVFCASMHQRVPYHMEQHKTYGVFVQERMRNW